MRQRRHQAATAPPVVVKRPQRQLFNIGKIEPELQTNGFLYTFVIVYILANALIFFVGAAPEWAEALLARQPAYVRVARAVARGAGALLNCNSAIVILVSARRLITYLRSTLLNMVVPFDKAMPNFHSLVGHVIVYATAAHCIGHGVNYVKNKLQSPGFHGYNSLLITGVALAAVVLAMRVALIASIRKKVFELFYYTHLTCFVLYYVLLVVHGAHHGVLTSWKYVVGPLVIYCIDRISRLLRNNIHGIEISPNSAITCGNKIVCLRIPRIFNYMAGQYCDIKVPLVSNVQWHPFTIASSPHENEMMFYIKATGNWTSKFCELFKDKTVFDGDIKVHIRGPFGSPAQHVDQYEHIVLISGGVGATPFASIAKYAHHWILNYTQRGANEHQTVANAFTRSQSVMNAIGSEDAVNAPNSAVLGGGGPDSALQPDIKRHGSGSNRSGNLMRNVSNLVSRTVSFNPATSIQPQPQHLSDRRTPAEDYSNGGSFPGPSGMYGVTSGSSDPALRGVASTRTFPAMPEVVLDLPYHAVSNHSGGHPPRSGDMAGFFSDGSAGGSNFSQSGAPGSADPLLDLGDPTAPVPNRRAGLASATPSPTPSSGLMYSGSSRNMVSRTTSSRRVMNDRLDNFSSGLDDLSRTDSHGRGKVEAIRECNSTTSLFSDLDDDTFEAVDDEETGPSLVARRDSGLFADSAGTRTSSENEFDSANLDSGDVEDMILRNVPLESNAAELIGVSMGSTAMVRHLMGFDGNRHIRPSLMRASMTFLDEARDSASLQERILFYLHTVTVNWFLLWIMLLRYCIAAIVGILSHGRLIGRPGLAVFVSRPLVVVDLIFALILVIPVMVAIVFELRIHGMSIFLADSYGNMFDIILLLPLASSCAVLSILALADVGKSVQHISKVTMFLFWPVMSMLLLWRIGRTIGSRILLAQYFRSTHSTTRSLDFIWMSSKFGEDDWLVREMLPLAESNIVRLHRFITSEKAEDAQVEPWTLDYEHVPLKTHYGRPDWNEVFEGIAERSKSGSVIGVFLCGPNSIWVAVQQAAMRAMAKSLDKAYRVGYQHPRNDPSRDIGQNPVRPGMRPSPSIRPNPAASHGCAVRFNLREEQFY
jgi:FAD-binding domain/Ferric reductase like transmembrane component/Ferric reductase NAD binding domain